MTYAIITFLFSQTIRRIQSESYVKGFDAGRAGAMADIRKHAEEDPETGNMIVTISRELWQHFFPR